jgi:hypothetical protein
MSRKNSFFKAAKKGSLKAFKKATKRLKGAKLHKLDKKFTKAYNINVKDSFGWTALHYAARWGHHGIVKELLKKENAYCDPINDFLETPLHLSVLYDHPRIQLLLLKHGANPKAKDANGLTPEQLYTSKYEKFVTRQPWEIKEHKLDSEVLEHHFQEKILNALDQDNYDVSWKFTFEEYEAQKSLEPESDDHWADRMRVEFERKYCAYTLKKKSAGVKKAKTGCSTNKIEEGHWLLLEAYNKHNDTDTNTRWREDYESKWARWTERLNSLQCENDGRQKQLKYSDIPWPYLDGELSAEKLLLGDIKCTNPAVIKKKIKKEILRWHPDKFLTEDLLKMFKEDEKELIIEKVNQLVQDLINLKARYSEK